MQIYPAIDLKDGKCVRLTQGDYNQLTLYGDNPVEVALRWQNEGASSLHLVDLDGAKQGKKVNVEAIQAIIKKLEIPIQLGGGIRTLEDISFYLKQGIHRVILGSAVLQNPKMVKEALKMWGADRIVIGIDAKQGKVAIEGWLEVTAQSAIDLGKQFRQWGIESIIYTDISKDGMMNGPNKEETEAMIQATQLKVIASGGVAHLSHLKQLEQIGVEGAIIGRALYTGDILLKEALAFQKGALDAK